MTNFSVKYFLLFYFIFNNVAPLQAMLLPLARFSGHARKNSSFAQKTPAQKRSTWSHKHFQQISDLIPKQINHFSPLFGAALMESQVLKQMLLVNVQDPSPIVHIAHLLFHQLNPNEPVLPTANKSMAAYSLSPNILGLVMGAIEKGTLENQQDYLIHEWQTEYLNLTKDKKKISAKKIKELLALINEGHKYDKNSLNFVLLAFLHAKANPENNKDLINFLDGINQYTAAFPEQENVFGLQMQKDFNSNGNIIDGFERKDYVTFEKNLLSLPTEDKKITYAKQNFPLTLSFLIEKRKISWPYPPKVVAEYQYGYKGQPPVGICVETTLQDLFNNLLYNNSSKSFDLSLLPSHLQINHTFKNFYTKYRTIDTINAPSTAQAFMDLVSDVQGISYNQGNYEINVKDMEKTITTLCNNFFGINVRNLRELSKALSDHRRTVSFSSQPLGQCNDPRLELISDITIEIVDNQNPSHKKTLTLYGLKVIGHELYHAVFQTPKHPASKNFFNTSSLLRQYEDPHSRAIFLLDEKPSIHPAGERSSSLYYTLPAETNASKFKIIRTILSENKHNKEAIDYAFSLFKFLPEAHWTDIASLILTSGIFQRRLDEEPELNSQFNKFIAQNAPSILKKMPRLDESFITNFYQRIKSDDLKQELRKNIWNDYQQTPDDQDIYHNIDMLMFIAKGNLLHHDPIFDTRFRKEITFLLKNQPTKHQLLSDIVDNNFLKDIYTILDDESLRTMFIDELMTIDSNKLSPNLMNQREAEIFDFYNSISQDHQAKCLLYIQKNFSSIKGIFDEKIRSKIYDLFVHNPAAVIKAVITHNYITEMFAAMPDNKIKENLLNEIINVYKSLTQTEQITYISNIIEAPRIFGINNNFDTKIMAIMNDICAINNLHHKHQKTTPLHMAVQAINPTLAQHLLDSGKHAHVVDGKGQVPLYYAQQLRKKGQNRTDLDMIISLLMKYAIGE